MNKLTLFDLYHTAFCVCGETRFFTRLTLSRSVISQHACTFNLFFCAQQQSQVRNLVIALLIFNTSYTLDLLPSHFHNKAVILHQVPLSMFKYFMPLLLLLLFPLLSSCVSVLRAEELVKVSSLRIYLPCTCGVK